MVRRRHAGLAGEGARLYGGRFNPRGVPAVYASASIALAALEVLVHVEKSEIPADFVALGVELGDEQIQSLSAEEARMAGNLAAGSSASVESFKREFYAHSVLRVPSVIIPREHNYALLPEAANFDARILWVEPFAFDERLFALAADA